MACTAGGGHSDKGEDAGRADAVRAEACGEGREVVRLP